MKNTSPHFLTLSVNVSIAIVLASLLCACQNNDKKVVLASEANFNSDWQFGKADNAPELTNITAWEKVQLPHTTKIESLVVSNQWQGDAWYKKTITTNPNWKNKQVFIRFDSAMNASEVFLNGKKISTHLGGYLPFTVNLSSDLKFDAPNELVVHLDNRDNAITGPKPLKNLDFNTYGGIYRNVYLIVKNDLYISDAISVNKTAGGGIFVSYPEVTDAKATVKINTHLVNSSSNEKSFHINQQLMDGEKLVVESKTDAHKIATQSTADIESQLDVKTPNLWAPQNPHLYTLVTQVFDGDNLVEQKNTRIGIREFTFTDDHQLLINGKKAFLRGVNRHQEHPYVGYATSDAADYRDAVRMKSAGFDYVRLSHYPHSPAFMDAADELGLVLLDSVLGWQYFSENPAFQAQVQQTCRDLIRRDRNHASVLAWECSLNESWMTEPFIDSLTKIVHEEYPGKNVFSAGWQEYGYDIYLQARQHRLKDYHAPTKPYNVSEYGDWEYYAMNAGLNQTAWSNLLQADRSSRQLLGDGEKRLLQQAANIQESHNDNLATTPAFADGYWVMFDYNRGYSPDLESSGVMSIERLPKYGYFFYQSQRDIAEKSDKFGSGAMVYIASEWNEKSPLNVRVFSNAEQVELFLNGVSLGKQKSDSNNISDHLKHPPFTFALKQFMAGDLRAVAYVGDKPAAEYKVATAGKATQLKLSLDTSGKPAQAGVKDVVFVRAQLQDAAGNPTHDNKVAVSFAIKGAAKLVSPVEINSIDGVASALIELGDNINGVVISAQAKDITTGETSL
jgi:beta-galactosidase